MESCYPGGCIIEGVSDPLLLMKHLAAEAYNQSDVLGAGVIPAAQRAREGGPVTPEEISGQINGKSGNTSHFEYWRVGDETKRLLGIIPVKQPLLLKTVCFRMDYVMGHKVKWGFSIDELGNFYLPKEFHGQSSRQIAEKALQAAKREDTTLMYEGISNRLPPHVEAQVNTTYIRLLEHRKAVRGQVSFENEESAVIRGCNYYEQMASRASRNQVQSEDNGMEIS